MAQEVLPGLLLIACYPLDMTEDQLDTRDKIGGDSIVRDQKDVFDIQ